MRPRSESQQHAKHREQHCARKCTSFFCKMMCSSWAREEERTGRLLESM